MSMKKIGRHTLIFTKPASVVSYASVAGKKEGEGPLGKEFDVVNTDTTFGCDSWEQAESAMQTQAVEKALEKINLNTSDVDNIFAGDLLNQSIGSVYGVKGFEMPFVGLYGACSTMALSLAIASVFVSAGASKRAAAVTSSHFCSAERQFRFPLEYSGQRPAGAQWTATAAGAVVLETGDGGPFVKAVTLGKICDYGITDSSNMGAAMAPAAADTLMHFLEDTKTNPCDYDIILTGDLSQIGTELMNKLCEENGYDIFDKHADCGLMIYDIRKQDVNAGGSGCGCSGGVLCSRILNKMKKGELNEVLFIGTGALMSPTSVGQGKSISAVAHLVHLSNSGEETL